MGMPLSEWDEKIRPRLWVIEVTCGRIKRDVQSVLENVRELACRPEWETIAESKIEEAITVLEAATAGLKQAQKLYRSKKLDA